MLIERRQILGSLAAAAALASPGIAAAQMLPPPTGLPAGSVAPVGDHVVGYVEVEPGTEARAITIMAALGAASAKDAGSKSYSVFQRIGSPHHFGVLEQWTDNAAREAHLAQAHLKTAREQLGAIETAPYDERPHRPLATGEASAVPAGAILAITHVDFVPVYREEGETMLKMLAEASRAEPGAARFDVLTQASRPNHMTLIEAWTSDDAWRKHLAAKHTKDFRRSLLPRSGSLYDERLFKALA